MNLIRGKHNIPTQFPATVITLGNFDGVHRGHQQLIFKLKELAEVYQCPSLLITFEPLTHELFAREKLPRLMRFQEKYQTLQEFEIDHLLCIRFDKKFAQISAEDFIKNILVDRLNAKAVIVGDDFRFGANRQGDFALLQQLGKKYGFEAQQMTTLTIQDERVSSSRVRMALQAGDLISAQHYLGRNYSLIGKVVRGEQRGRKLGFPTANIDLHRRLVALSGVFVVRALGLNHQPVYGVANIGVRPTFQGTRVLLEVHFFNFDQDIYGRKIKIEFLNKIRDEQRFEKFEHLIAQIHKDIESAKRYLTSR